jgi:hypothetical protein
MANILSTKFLLKIDHQWLCLFTSELSLVNDYNSKKYVYVYVYIRYIYNY